MRVVVAELYADPDAEKAGRPRADALGVALEASGHAVDFMRFPIAPQPDKWVRQLGAIRLINYSVHSDRLICLSPLASVLSHPRKVRWSDELLSDVLPERFDGLDRRLAAETAIVPLSADGYEHVLPVSPNVASPLAIPDSDAGWDDVVSRLLAA